MNIVVFFFSIFSNIFQVFQVILEKCSISYHFDDNNITEYFQRVLGNLFQFNNSPISDHTFQKGDKIRVDSQNNAWITTRHSGVRVIKNNATLWPDGNGFLESNSPLLSDMVYDIIFDNQNGKVYLATKNGISILDVPFSNENKSLNSLYVSPYKESKLISMF